MSNESSPPAKPHLIAMAGELLGYDTGMPAEGDTTTGPEGVDEESISTWRPVDLGPALAGETPPPGVIFKRTDGLALLYAGKTHQFYGETESCKTWGALVAAIEVLDAGGLVLWIDYEDGPATVVERLRALGASPDQIRAGIHYINPEEATQLKDGRITGGGVDFHHLITANTYTLAVIDGVTEGMTAEGLDPLGTIDAAEFGKRIARKIARTGAAVVTLDHVSKSHDEGGKRFALGSQHKTSGITGAAYLFEPLHSFHRATPDNPEVHGAISIKVSKDRPGHVRAGADGYEKLKRVAIMHLTAYWGDGGVTSRLERPDIATETPPAKLMAAIANELAYTDGLSLRGMENAIGGKADTTRRALKHMTAAGLLTVEKSGQSHRHYLTDLGRAQLLPAAD